MYSAVQLPPFGTFGDPSLLVELAQSAEASGWDGFFLWDHIAFDTDVPFADSWSALSAIAASTSRIRIGPLVTPLSRRRAWVVARQAVTVDHLSGGRLTMGVGLGIDFWREFSGFGGEAQDDRTRAGLVDESLDVVTRLWSSERVDYDGVHLQVHGMRFLPAPVQRPRVPIWTAALWPLRPGPRRRAARWDGVAPFSPSGPITPTDVEALRAEIASERGDDRFDVCLSGPRALAGDYEAAGTTWLLESFLPDEAPGTVRAAILEGPPR